MELKAVGKIDSAGMRNAVQIIKGRLLRFGIDEENIRVTFNKDLIHVKVANVDDTARVASLVSKTGNLEFWETYDIKDLYARLEFINRQLAKVISGDSLNSRESVIDTTVQSEPIDTTSLVGMMKRMKTDKEVSEKRAFEKYKKDNPLFAILNPNVDQTSNGNCFFCNGANICYSKVADTSEANKILDLAVKNKWLPYDLLYRWDNKPTNSDKSLIWLIALRCNESLNGPVLDGSVLVKALQDYDKTGKIIITMEMSSYGGNMWKRITKKNIGKSIAIVVDGEILSYPVVQSEIPNGRSVISGNFTIDEGKDLATILTLGKLPCELKVLKSESVEEKLLLILEINYGSQRRKIFAAQADHFKYFHRCWDHVGAVYAGATGTDSTTCEEDL